MEEGLTLAVGTKGADEAKAKLQGVSDALTGTGKSTTDWSDKLTKAGLAIGAVGVGLTAYSKSATNSYTDYVKSVNGIARITGEAVDQTSRLQYVFSRAGIDAGNSATVFGTFSKQIQKTNDANADAAATQADLNNKIDAAKIKISDLTADTKKNGDANGSNANQIQALNLQIDDYKKKLGEAATPLQKLGVATQDATGKTRPFSDILLDVADKFKAMQNGPEKTALSMQLFGKSGKNLIPILNKGSDGIKDLEAQADKLGLTLSGANVDAVAKYTEAHKKMKDAQTAFTLAVGAEALPMYQKLADAQVALTEKYKELPAGVQQAVTAVVAFGGPVMASVGSITTLGANISSINWGGIGKGIKGVTGFVGNMAGGFKDGVVWIATHTAALIKNGVVAAATAVKWVALKVAQGAIVVATYAWTAAQWALNVALNANPISLIIIALVALAAGIVLLWQHSQTFRDIVTGAFNAVWGAIQAVWNWISTNWPLLLAILTGPIGIAVYMIVTHWETIKAAFAAAWAFIQAVWAGVAGWFGGVWQGIVNVFAGVGGWFASVFSSAWQNIKNIFAGVGGFFQGLWNTIVSIMGSIGSTVANTISGAVKGVVNGILSGAEGIINGFINSINGVVGTINKIPGVNIGKIGQFHLPRLAEGGIVKATPGGVLANIAEGGKDEAVIPLDKLEKMMKGNGTQVNFYGNITLATKEASDAFFNRLNAQAELASMGVPV